MNLKEELVCRTEAVAKYAELLKELTEACRKSADEGYWSYRWEKKIELEWPATVLFERLRSIAKVLRNDGVSVIVGKDPCILVGAYSKSGPPKEICGWKVYIDINWGKL